MRKIIFTGFIFCGIVTTAAAQNWLGDAMQLLQRIVPQHSKQFILEIVPKENDKDVFEIDRKGNSIVLRGNNGVAVASALYYYLNEFCHTQITWNGVNMHLPAILPLPKKRIHKNTPYEYRYYLNYCTFNYSMSWWDWNRWEKEIDWMALHGINMPLSITGEEYTWYLVYKEMGFTDAELANFFCGPSYFSWFWMGNLDGWGGPLPLSWMKNHFALQQKIIARERALGMKPVLPAFTGHVPAAFKTKFPNAKLKQTNWTNGFADTYILDSEDPMFAQIGKHFLQQQTELLGTDHLYSADTFNENEPPGSEPEFLGKLSARVYEGMRQADTAAIWVMQGWLFYSDRKFWKEPQTEALLNAVPNNKMIVLDLATEIEPVWKRTRAFYGKPWIWNMLNNFGGNTNLFGRMETVATEPAKALHDAQSGQMKGIGLTMEGIEQNPVLYELMTNNTWNDQPIDVNEWIKQYITNRYGVLDNNTATAWNVLRNTVYTVPANKYKRDGAESIIQARPTLDSLRQWANTRLNYDAKDLLPAWDAMMKAIPACKNSDGFRFDLVDVARQVLANYALPLQRQIVNAYHAKDSRAFQQYSTAFIALMKDMDRLLATRKDFLLGPWIAAARRNGAAEKEKALYEFNAKDLITLWGDKNCPLNEYACRQWSGLINDFYVPRWQQFFAAATKAMEEGKEMDNEKFTQQMKNWEWHWVNARKDYPVTTTGDLLKVVTALYQKYQNTIRNAY
ncbi:MAG: alpha-N-acetylglucosaminidase [Bacteroidetes bacterium]|nr:alpha-N-acetylglucosaminidase [Bacteroidota bacterium]